MTDDLMLSPITDPEEPFIDPETGWDVRMAERMARSILMAHEANPDSWALITTKTKPGMPFLNIGGTNACAFYQLTVAGKEAESIDPVFVELHNMGRTFKSDENQGLVVLQFAPGEVPDVLPSFEVAHESAVRQMSPYTSPRKPEHKDEFRSHLERVTGLEIPVPSYYSSVRNSAFAESSVGFPRHHDGAPDLGAWPKDVLLHIAQTILSAHDRSAGSWALRMRNEEITLYINRPKIIACTPTDVHMLVAGDADELNRDFPSGIHLSKGRSFQYPSTWVANIPATRFVDTLQLIGEAHREIFDRLAPAPGTFVRINRSREHDQGLVESLSKHLGFELPAPDYWAAEQREHRTLASADGGYSASAQNIRRQFASAGLTYSADQIATFYTALQTKGFVVLSGISGTGKSKIAQHFVQMLPQPTVALEKERTVPQGVIPLSLNRSVQKYRRAIIPVSQVENLPLLAPDSDMRLNIVLGDIEGTGRLERRTHVHGTDLHTLHFHGDIARRLAAQEVGSRYFVEFLPENDDSGSSIARIHLNLADVEHNTAPQASVVSDVTEHPNSLFLAVRPDWRDSTSLLGYYNPLTETYEWTEFLRFLLRAADDYREYKEDALAWFVILDEMNLAHVEYYFADLLSIIESGRDDEGWSREPIRLTYPDATTDNPPPHEILLPPNLYIIGTVNMDETTHAFSPKVLDRAFTIELTDVDFSAYPPDVSDSNGEVSEEERRSLLNAFTNGGTFAQIRKDDIRQAVQEHPEIRDWLQNLNSRLAVHQFHFGYRVFDEIAQFIYHADRNGMFDSWIAAFDHAVYMKVLPKFNGSHARLDGPLTALIDWAKDPSRLAGTSASSGDTVGIGEDENNDSPALTAPQLTRVLSRARRMKELLEANGFVSFG